MIDAVEIAVVGDPHGQFDARIDGPLLARFPLRLCTGDLAPNRGRERFDEALRIARELAGQGVHCVLGNHDGPTPFTGRSFPKAYLRLVEALGPFHVAMSVRELPELGLSLVGARPLSMGGDDLRFTPPDASGRTKGEWCARLLSLLLRARGERIIVLAHDGPSGLGAERDSIYGCDFRKDAGDWGDSDLRVALDLALDAGRPIVAVIAGHMHHALRGGGDRVTTVRERGVLHVNAAVVPRVAERGRALTVVRLRGMEAEASVEWM